MIRTVQKTIMVLTMIWFSMGSGMAQINFSQWFRNQALRIDYHLSGNHEEQHFFLEELKIERYWSGSHKQTIANLNLGSYKVEVFDLKTKKLLYLQGFSTLFEEWQSVEEAKFLSRSFEQVTRIPLPKDKVMVRFSHREKNGEFVVLSELEIDPKSMFISKHRQKQHKTTQLVKNGNPNTKLDIVFIAEGYTAQELPKFLVDVQGLVDFLFSQEPFKHLKSKINIWAIESPSEHSGPTNPGTNTWNNTAVQSTFYTFGIDRYLTTSKYKKVMDIASNAPGDVVYVLVNSDVYGGGGIYNHYNVSTANHYQSKEVFIHELGHGLAGLGDEYYESEVAYEDFYNLSIEPWEPNLTTLANFSIKWQDMLEANTPIPTPVTEEYSQTVGVFQGGGYSAVGIYRPYVNCRMRSNSAPSFCPVCSRAIERVVQSYAQ